MLDTPSVIIADARNGERFGSATLLAATPDIMIQEFSLEPGSAPGNTHYHAQHTDAFYVLEGELEFQIEGRAVRAGPGTLLVAPRGALHAFPVAIGSRARFLNIHAPGGFDKYMRELTAMRARGEQPDKEFLRAHDQYED
jgi:quercetin dioxygenase-like cupin family protein